jgi:ribonuclease Z
VIQVIFIGTGPSLPPPGRGNTAFVARSAYTSVLVDCGPTVQFGAQRAQVELSLIPHVFISHCHGDHMLGFPMLVLDRMVAGWTMCVPPLNVFCPASMVETLQDIARMSFPEFEFTGALRSIHWHPMPEDRAATIELAPDLVLTTRPVGGPPLIPTLGVRLDFQEGISIAYSSDTAQTEEVPKLAQGCDLLVHEAYCSITVGSRVPEFYHSSGRGAGINASLAKCRKLALVHLGPLAYGREAAWAREASETFFGEIVVPADGDILRLNGAGKKQDE